ncbi:hypothetical protein NXC14_PA00271 (plasmid) [Rhizobium sp. NXC14]|nr:hypothetical protein NXC14_PA00271 [Rhizobium sp. NXC14]
MRRLTTCAKLDTNASVGLSESRCCSSLIPTADVRRMTAILMYHMEHFLFSDTHRRLRPVPVGRDATMTAVLPHID